MYSCGSMRDGETSFRALRERHRQQRMYKQRTEYRPPRSQFPKVTELCFLQGKHRPHVERVAVTTAPPVCFDFSAITHGYLMRVRSLSGRLWEHLASVQVMCARDFVNSPLLISSLILVYQIVVEKREKKSQGKGVPGIRQ